MRGREGGREGKRQRERERPETARREEAGRNEGLQAIYFNWVIISGNSFETPKKSFSSAIMVADADADAEEEEEEEERVEDCTPC